MSLRSAIVGFGLSGRMIHRPLLEASGFDVVAVGVRNPETRQPLEGIRFARLDDILADTTIDLIVIASPNDLHFEHASRAIEAGKHVVIEKPLATTSQAARLLCEAAASTDRVVTVFHSRRWDGDFLTLQRVLETRAIGDWQILESRWSMNKLVAQDRWKDRDDRGGGLLADFMPHLIDQALHLFGPPDRATVDLATQRDRGVGADYVCVTLAYGRKRVILSADCFGMSPSLRFRLAGSAAEFVCGGIDPQETQLRANVRPLSADFGRSDPGRLSLLTLASGEATNVPLERGRYLDFYTDLKLAIEKGSLGPVLIRDAERVVKLVDALREP